MTNRFIFTLIYTFIFGVIAVNAQTYRDSLAYEIIHNYSKNPESYSKLKTDLKKLEEIEGKPNPEILYSKLESVYSNKDTEYFKEILLTLTKDYGFNISYTSGYENYYNSIIKGELSVWFKEMYIKNHSVWLAENLDKQVDIFKLNSFHKLDQEGRRFFGLIRNLKSLSQEQLVQIRKLEGEVFKTNFDELIEISNEIGFYPSGNSFALIQKNFGIVNTHILQHEDTFEEAWPTLYPLYKKAYLNNDISSVFFRNIDSYIYLQNGYQVFDLLKKETIPEQFIKDSNQKEIPLLNTEQTKKFRQELNW